MLSWYKCICTFIVRSCCFDKFVGAISWPAYWGSRAAGRGSTPEPGLSARASLRAASRRPCCTSSRGSRGPAGGKHVSTHWRRPNNICRRKAAKRLTVWRMRMWASSRTSAVTTWGARDRKSNPKLHLVNFCELTTTVRDSSISIYRNGTTDSMMSCLRGRSGGIGWFLLLTEEHLMLFYLSDHTKLNIFVFSKLRWNN